MYNLGDMIYSKTFEWDMNRGRNLNQKWWLECENAEGYYE